MTQKRSYIYWSYMGLLTLRSILYSLELQMSRIQVQCSDLIRNQTIMDIYTL